jgi:drug/metabolite transporter (DMT)-like permease
MPDLVLAGVTVIWGSSFVVVRHALDTAPPLALLFWRFLLASALMALLVARRARPGHQAVRDGLVLGGLLALGMSIQILGQAETTASKAGFLTGLAVVLTPFAAILRTRRLPTLPNGLGVALASAGFVLLTFPAAGAPVNRGDLLVGACAVVFAFYGVEMAQRAGRHDALWLTAIQVTVTAAFAGALSLALRLLPAGIFHAAALEARPVPPGSGFLWSVAYLGSVGTVVAILGWTWSQGRMSAIHGAILLALEPVFASVFGSWFLGEQLGRRGFWGAGFVLAGIVVSELPWLRLAQSRGKLKL